MNKYKSYIIDPNILTSQGLSYKDKTIITSHVESGDFNPSTDYIESILYDLNNNLVAHNNNFRNFEIPNISSIILNPDDFLLSQDIDNGEFNILYNFVRYELGCELNSPFYIKQISPSRKEIKITSLNIDKDVINNKYLSLKSKIDSDPLVDEFYIKLEDNLEIIGVNFRIDEKDPTVLVLKLYEPLPTLYEERDQIWVTTKPAESVAFNIKFDEIVYEVPTIKIKGPNINVNIQNLSNVSSTYLSQENLMGNDEQNQDLINIFNNIILNKDSNLKINYNQFENFVHFSSIQSRLNNFKYKLELLESYEIIVDDILKNKQINKILSSFDGYEYFLYYDTGENSCPKSDPNIFPPTLYNTSSEEFKTWFDEILERAFFFDDDNSNCLKYLIPLYIRENEENLPYIKFIDMVGQYYDTIWVYIKNITTFINNDNNPYEGVSSNIIEYILESFGLKLPQSSLDNPIIQDWLVVKEGDVYRLLKDIQREIYQRIYHNWVYLVKKKGTLESIRQLINIWGIPDVILSPREYYNKPLNPPIHDTYGYDLSKEISIEKPSYTIQDNLFDKKYNILEVGFSPSYLTDEEIIEYYNSQSLDVGEIVSDILGDPLEHNKPGTKYQTLIDEFNNIRDYLSNPNLYEFIQITHFFDSALFNTVKEFTPAKTNLNTGLIIKPHILDRNRIHKNNLDLDGKDLHIVIDNTYDMNGGNIFEEFYINTKPPHKIDPDGVNMVMDNIISKTYQKIEYV